MEQVTVAVVQVLVQNLYDSLQSQAQSAFRFRSEFGKMKTKLDIMTSFLTDAQQLERKQDNYSTVKKILAQLRDVIYDADDIVLDCRIREEYENNFPIRRYTPRAKVFRHDAERALHHINKRIDDMENKLRTYLNTMNQMMQNSNERRQRQTSRALTASKIIGLTEETQKIVGWITTKDKSHHIGIVGMGGSGKTTIAQQIFNDQNVVKHFDVRIWVSVSQTFTEQDILTSIVEQLRVDKSVLMNDDASLIQHCLKNKKYLIVVDDVWRIMNYAWWRQISDHRPEQEKCNNSIIITTRREDVATDMGVTTIHRAPRLSEEESWSLFCDVAFSLNKKMSLDSEFQTVGKVIVDKCDGFPLAIKTIARILSTKTQSLHRWKEVSMNYRHELQNNTLNNNTSVVASLQLSYDDLPANLKHCILCFSIYPENTIISARQLVYWWVSEGFVHEDGSKTAIEVAFQCLREMVNRCLVEVVEQRGYDGRIYKCKMHDMVRELIIKMSNKEAFSRFDERWDKPVANSRHVGYTSGMDEKLFENSSNLRAFLLMHNSSFALQRNTGLATVKSLRVLDLSRNKLHSINVGDLLKWIKSQKRLAFLSLRKVSDLKELPDWIKKRKNLQILVITECSDLKRLPPSITTLQNMVVLDVENCPLLNLPSGLGRLTKLQVLSGFKLTKKGKDGTSLSELKGLAELRVLRIKLGKNDEVADDEVDFLSGLYKLKVLSIDSKDCEKTQVLLVNKLEPPPSLQELYLMSYDGDTMPNWVSPSSLPELLYLHIEDGQLRSVSANFWDSSGNPWKIEGLCFMNLVRFKLDWEVIQNNMKYLRYVEVTHCQGLQSFPCDVNNYGVWDMEENNE